MQYTRAQSFISIRAPLAGSDLPPHQYAAHRLISIRAPLAGSDARYAFPQLVWDGISIRAPLAGSDRYIL